MGLKYNQNQTSPTFLLQPLLNPDARKPPNGPTRLQMSAMATPWVTTNGQVVTLNRPKKSCGKTWQKESKKMVFWGKKISHLHLLVDERRVQGARGHVHVEQRGAAGQEVQGVVGSDLKW